MALIKTKQQIAFMREGGKILAEALFIVVGRVKPGVTTDELDRVFREAISRYGAEPSFLGYHGYPKTICTSVNDEVVHGIPGARVLTEGDSIGVDCGVRFKGFCTDMARTVPVGVISKEAEALIQATTESLQRALAVMYAGNTTGDIGHAVQTYVERLGYGVVRDLVGHGVGEDVHEEPSIPNYGSAGTGLRLEPGMVVAVEPMVNAGTHEVIMDDDGWTIRTADGTLSAHVEDTIVITDNGPEVLTKV